VHRHWTVPIDSWRVRGRGFGSAGKQARVLFGESDITVDIVIRMFCLDRQTMYVSFVYNIIL
jgi:hypothetical protein